ncbi:hypothetical protein DYB30_009368 [Aphanomyces astaci]|uniref:FCH domain-containing protein n=1 Tax=Aphanomyces astaci TaxID=112090 RepID=A0A397DR58_APHAT|nr:hypothetical protein DYB30_009368 [Aphanomyces astaci]
MEIMSNADSSTLHFWSALNLSIAQCGCECFVGSNAADLDDLLTQFVQSEFDNLVLSEPSVRQVAQGPTLLKGRLQLLTSLLERGDHPELLEAFTTLYMSSVASMSWSVVSKWMGRFGLYMLAIVDSTQQDTFKAIFRVSIGVLTRLPPAELESEHMASWLTSVVAFFTSTTNPVWFGQLPWSTQLEAVALLHHLPTYPPAFLRTLAACCKAEILHKLDRGALLNFYMSTLFAQGNELLCPQVCRLLSGLNFGSSLSSILAPTLAKQSVEGNAVALVMAFVVCLKSNAKGSGGEKQRTPDVLKTHLVASFVKVLVTPQLEAAYSTLVYEGMRIATACSWTSRPSWSLRRTWRGCCTQDTTSCAPVSYQFHLFGAFNAVCSKGKNGVQTCQAISSYLQDRAAHEQFYSKQLAKIQQNVKTEDWAKHVANTWNTFHHTIAAISLEYAEFSNMHTSSIVSGMKACTSQQESQIQRLITEGSKLRTQYVECMNKMSKAKERYDKKCAEAIDTIQSIRRPPAADGTSDKVDIFSKVWDNTAKGLGLGSLERQKQRMASCLEDVVASEDAYVRAVDAMNIQYTSYERQVQDNLIAFEVTEEQRLEYIKDLLVRSEKSRNAMVGRVERLISGMREALKSIDVLGTMPMTLSRSHCLVLDDIDDGFTKLLGLKHKEGDDVELQVDISPASITALVLKMQTMTDQGVVFTHMMLNTLVECISAEETLVGALERIHTSYSPLSNEAATLFSSAAPVVFAEGTTLDRGWGAVLMHMQRVAYLHKEFGSLLAEPVSLSLDTMKTEYIETKLKMDDELHHLMASVATDMASHTKLEQKLDAKSKELAVTKASLASNIEKDAMLQRFMESPVDRERKLVVKSDQLQDEVADLKGQVDASGAAMTAKLEPRRQVQHIFL